MKQLTPNKTIALILSRQAKGTIVKVVEMVENDEYCINVLQQIDSIIGTLTKVKKELLASHLHHCLETKLKENKEKAVQELMKIYKFSS